MWSIDSQLQLHRAWLDPNALKRLNGWKGTWAAIFLSPQFAEREAAEAEIVQMYQRAGLKSPRNIIWCSSPQELARMNLDESVVGKPSNRFWRAMAARAPVKDPILVSLLRVVRHGKHRTASEKLGMAKFKQITPWVAPYRDVCLVSERPAIIHRNARGRYHHRAAPALVYPDGFSLYAINGVFVDERIVMRPQEITRKEIEWEFNIEIRRFKIEQFGIDRYLLDVEDGQFSRASEVVGCDSAGILYRRRDKMDEDILMVRVLNQTPEPDGTLSREDAIEIFGMKAGKVALDAPEGSRFKEYMIRVPPTMKTAREAVAWTFGLSGEDYMPAVES